MLQRYFFQPWYIFVAAMPLLTLIGLLMFVSFNNASWLDEDPNQLAGCAWHTDCWHDEYLDLFVYDGLVKGRRSEGDFLGLVTYQLNAVTTENLLTLVSVLLAITTFLVGIEVGRNRLRRQHTVDSMMSLF